MLCEFWENSFSISKLARFYPKYFPYPNNIKSLHNIQDIVTIRLYSTDKNELDDIIGEQIWF
jgi:predicted phosphohydrolase